VAGGGAGAAAGEGLARRIHFWRIARCHIPYFGWISPGMRELGHVEGKDFTIEWRFADGSYERFPHIATELVKLKVDVIVLATPVAIRPVQQATATIPIVMVYSTDPVGNGFVASLARPAVTLPD
jgi:putative tryptophan/tyrosine transport system substrate-binding protein